MTTRDKAAYADQGFDDPEYGWCAWRSGERCRYPGTSTLNTRGGGPWYCAGHLQCNDAIAGAQMVEASIRDCGERPNYTLAGRRLGLHARWVEEQIARGAFRPGDRHDALHGADAHRAVDETSRRLTA